MKLKRFMLSLVAGVCIASTGVYSKNQESSEVTKIKNTAVKEARNDADTKRKKLAKEAVDSLEFAHEALEKLQNKEYENAIASIEKALGKLEVILSAKESPKMLPIKSFVVVNEFIGSSDDVKKAVGSAQKLLSAGKVQQARKTLIPLVSEIDITTVSLPLASYPDALKLASTYIHDAKYTKAESILKIALNTFDEDTVVIPIPLIKATDLISAASSIAKKDKDKALMYLDAASESLKVAKELGYVSKSTTTYKALQEKIDETKKEIKGKNRAEKLFEALKDKLADFKKKIYTPED